MKKRLISTVVLAGMLLSVPALAADLSNTSVTGDTTVTAKVVGADTGNVTYTVTIPDKIDFGELKQPANSVSDPVNKDATVKPEIINGLPDGYRVAVFVKDAADTEEDPSFRVIGQDSANRGKVLTYTIKNSSTQANLLDGNRYTNGYLVGSFQNTDESTSLRLTLDQMQLFGQDLSAWAGNYKGTLNFYTRVMLVTELT